MLITWSRESLAVSAAPGSDTSGLKPDQLALTSARLTGSEK